MNVYRIFCEESGDITVKESEGWVFKDSSDGFYLFENKSIPVSYFFPVAKTFIIINKE